MRRSSLVVLLLALLLAALSVSNAAADTGEFGPAKGMVTMIDLGSDKCIPCRMMAPFLEELREEYKDKAAIIFVDILKNPEVGRRFGIRAIPTQIFYDKNGNEVTRHLGFLPKEAIVAMLQKLGVEK